MKGAVGGQPPELPGPEGADQRHKVQLEPGQQLRAPGNINGANTV